MSFTLVSIDGDEFIISKEIAYKSEVWKRGFKSAFSESRENRINVDLDSDLLEYLINILQNDYDKYIEEFGELNMKELISILQNNYNKSIEELEKLDMEELFWVIFIANKYLIDDLSDLINDIITDSNFDQLRELLEKFDEYDLVNGFRKNIEYFLDSLFKGIEENNINRVNVAIIKEANLEKTNEGGYTPLTFAIETARKFDNDPSIVSLLIDSLANVDGEDQNGWTPLTLATSEAQESIIELLLSNGADVNKANDDGDTPMIIASDREGFYGLIPIFIGYGADINKTDIEGNSPLMIAASRGFFDTVKELLRYSLDLGIEDAVGRNVFNLSQHEGINALLEEYANDTGFFEEEEKEEEDEEEEEEGEEEDEEKEEEEEKSLTFCKDTTVKQLRLLAGTKNIKGRSKMNKRQLCDALGFP